MDHIELNSFTFQKRQSYQYVADYGEYTIRNLSVHLCHPPLVVEASFISRCPDIAIHAALERP